MGVSGRRPVPGGDVARAREGIQTGDVVEMAPPPDLTPDAAGLWEVAVTDLIALRMFRASDAPMLAEFCSSLAMARSFRRQIQELEPAIEDALKRKDYDTAGALSEIVKRTRSGYVASLKLAQSIGGDFGMTPTARLRLGLMTLQGAKLTSFFEDED